MYLGGELECARRFSTAAARMAQSKSNRNWNASNFWNLCLFPIHQTEIEAFQCFLLVRDFIDGHAPLDERANDLVGPGARRQNNQMPIAFVGDELLFAQSPGS